MPDDAKEAHGHGVRARRSKAGAVSFDVLFLEVANAPYSESVAALASALAKAQAELVNPEKSLIATILGGRAGEGEERSFRYAPLSAGWNRAQDAGPARDRHRSDHRARSGGRSGQADHHAGACFRRMDCVGLAGLPARRYGGAAPHGRSADLCAPLALFTLVGIAGEDDLDAPDLQDAAPSSPPSSAGTSSGSEPLRLSAGRATNGSGGPADPRQQPPTVPHGRARLAAKTTATAILAPDQSAALRDRILPRSRTSSRATKPPTGRATQLPPRTVSLPWTPGWSKPAFEQRLAVLAVAPDGATSQAAIEPATVQPAAPTMPINAATIKSVAASVQPSAAETSTDLQINAGPQPIPPSRVSGDAGDLPASIDPPGGIDKSVLTIAEPRRYRSKEHLRFVATRSLSDLRPQALRPTSSAFHPAARARPQGQRRVRGAALPGASPRAAPNQATNASGGKPPASTPSRSPASSGTRPG